MRRDLAGALQALQHRQQCLRPADGKGGQQHAAAARHRVAHDLRQPLRRVVVGGVQPVAVGGFDQQHVHRAQRLRRRHQDVAAAAQVAREAQGFAAAPQRHGAGAQQVADRREGHVHVTHPAHPARRQRHQLGDGPLGVGLGVERQRLGMAREALPVGAAGVFFLQVGAVKQQHLGQIAGGRAGVDRPAKARLHQAGQPAAVVQVGVAEHHRVNGVRGHAQRRPVALAQHLPALEQAAVEQDALVAQRDEVAGTGDGIGGAEELDLHGGAR